MHAFTDILEKTQIFDRWNQTAEEVTALHFWPQPPSIRVLRVFKPHERCHLGASFLASMLSAFAFSSFAKF